MIWSSIQGEMQNGNRVKCFGTTEINGIDVNCTRTHEVRNFNPIGVVSMDVETRSIIRNLPCEYGYDADDWFIIRTQPVMLGRSAMSKTYYIAFCPDHHSSIPAEITTRMTVAEAQTEPEAEPTTQARPEPRCRECVYYGTNSDDCRWCTEIHTEEEIRQGRYRPVNRFRQIQNLTPNLPFNERICTNCRFRDNHGTSVPCSTCINTDGWRRRTTSQNQRNCLECSYHVNDDCTNPGLTCRNNYLHPLFTARTQTPVGGDSMPRTQDNVINDILRRSPNPTQRVENRNGNRPNSMFEEDEPSPIRQTPVREPVQAPAPSGDGIWAHHKKI